VRNFDFQPAATTDRAIELLQGATAGDAARPRILAGGTDLLDEMKEGLSAPARLVNLKANRALSYARFDPAAGLRVGALLTLSELEAHPEVRARYEGIASALRLIASPQIRNMATVGGNLCQRPRCWYFRDLALHCARKGGDTCYAATGENAYHAILGMDGCVVVHPSDLAPALIAYVASITYAGPAGRKTLPLAEFFVGPGVDITRETVLGPADVVEEITVPAPAPGTRGVFLKVRDRATWDFATLSVAAVLEMDGARCRRGRIVMGAVAPVPWPSPEADKVISGARITPDAATRAAESALKGATPLRQNGYKVTLAKRLVRRAILQAAGVHA
jgi:xanthine dehydrogenase YagS FAD-binding subunit